ncbi:PorP/SprF family type IX secretion system membrane protein [Flammeovirga kamogawensis]|uniref:Type IX secretion system membrane protein PorP/SprF n=1 Tax=Flammeovirga kamogawensis TaxID=373891 RepID=A0ABX8H456_9BACT|nr:type IX secretion system membrane protein PorP/SprF [Flammeovirga kamogawensis]MBB6460308.1 type IX secretion system PorP/SprF family membrane protein [Flammeovirga kamogawensis]QWG10117.1 type IX secretion system membrane protein PorP/SprF [Flammeovirga kamogawensis]TRX65625.1 type IX secretion system membrane protein PorP/SprF [Flammeovirga kamogawensis]
MKKLLFSLLFILGVAQSIFAQQATMYSQYMFNAMLLNPAYIGAQGGVNSTFIYRQHWSGIGGSPSTATVAIDSPIGSKKIAVGALFSQDKIGVSTIQNFDVMLAYRIAAFNGTLSFGLQGGFNNVSVNFAQLTSYVPDPSIPSQTESKMTPEVGAGIFYNAEKLYAGISAPKLVENDLGDPNSTLVVEGKRHYYIIGGYIFHLSPNVVLKPNTLIKLTEGSPVQADINLNTLLYETLWLGVSYRTLESVAFITEIQFGKMFRVGYSYDLVTNSAQGVTNGSHEFMLNVLLKSKKAKIHTPRYY